MSTTTVDIPVELSPVAQVKLVLMAGIENRLLALDLASQGRALAPRGRPRSRWSLAAERLGIDESEISRLRSRQHKRFSVEQLIRLSVSVGVKITIRAE